MKKLGSDDNMGGGGDNKHSEREEEGAAAALDEKELRDVSAVVAGDFATSGMPDDEELGGESDGPRHAAVVAA